MSLCGDYGGLTVKGEPCRYVAGRGVPDRDTGRCSIHPEQEPQAQTITAPVGYLFAITVDGETQAAMAVTLTPYALADEPPLPPPDDDEPPPDEPPPPDDDEPDPPPDDPDEPDVTFGWLAPQDGETLSGASVELVARSPVEPQWRLVGKGGWHAFQSAGVDGEWTSTLPTGAVEDGVYVLELQAAGQETAAIEVQFQRATDEPPPPPPPPPPPDEDEPPVDPSPPEAGFSYANVEMPRVFVDTSMPVNPEFIRLANDPPLED